MKPLRKAIFPVAGLGTRLLPATKSIPKEMLTIVDRPLIHYAVSEAIEAGIEVLIFVTSRGKRAIADYFDYHPELEAELQAKGKLEVLESVRNIIPPHVSCVFIHQARPLGLGHAVLCAAEMIDDEPFAVLLPDDLIDGTSQGALAQLAQLHRQTDASVLAIEEVPRDKVHQYGIIASSTSQAGAAVIDAIVEKPSPVTAPSNWSVVGRYILPPQVMRALATQAPSVGGEIQLTDAIASCLPAEKFLGQPLHGRRFDCGNKEGFVEANLHFSLKQAAQQQ
jgi:UTP--glucose-1-phosphate uridylyltransferase